MTSEPRQPLRASRPFVLVLGGGGARGFAHAGVLRALEVRECRPRGIVGVSMGAVVAGIYAHRTDWYDAVLGMDLSAFPGPVMRTSATSDRRVRSIRRAFSYFRVMREMLTGWGPGTAARAAGIAELRRILGGHELSAGRVPIAVSATDLKTGSRVVLRSGSTVEAVYASAALAGVLPPLERGDLVLADGAYTDLSPVDVARELVPGAAVVAVDPGQPAVAARIENGLQAIMRAMEICHRRHAGLRFGEADLVVRPRFRRSIDTLDFEARRECIAAGIRAIRADPGELHALLEPPTA